MGSKDAWESILELARRIDDGVAARRGVDAQEAMALVGAVIEFQAQLTAGVVWRGSSIADARTPQPSPVVAPAPEFHPAPAQTEPCPPPDPPAGEEQAEEPAI
jgi:hypothetical protein